MLATALGVANPKHAATVFLRKSKPSSPMEPLVASLDGVDVADIFAGSACDDDTSCLSKGILGFAVPFFNRLGEAVSRG